MKYNLLRICAHDMLRAMQIFEDAELNVYAYHLYYKHDSQIFDLPIIPAFHSFLKTI